MGKSLVVGMGSAVNDVSDIDRRTSNDILVGIICRNYTR